VLGMETMLIRCPHCGAEANFMWTGANRVNIRYLDREQQKCNRLSEEIAAKGKANLAEFNCKYMADEVERAIIRTRRR
jgi:hypothetical protein